MAGADPFLDHCRSLPGVTEDVKWESNLVFSVQKKMFCVFGLPELNSFSFKAAPEVFETLTQHEGVEPAPYLARHQWLRVESLDTLDQDMAFDLLEEAHRLIASKLPKKKRVALGLD